jgi:hypothetical protein
VFVGLGVIIKSALNAANNKNSVLISTLSFEALSILEIAA